MNQNIIDFVGQKNIPVRIIDREQKSERVECPTTKYKYYVDGFNFAEYVLLTEVIKEGIVVLIRFFDGVNENSIYVKSDFKVGKLPKAKIKELFDNLHAYKIFGRQLFFDGQIGCDPEIFVNDGNGNILPAFKFLGSKEKPSRNGEDKRQPHLSNNKVYWDGFQAEFETTPNTCLGWHSDSIRHGLKAVFDLARKHDPNATLSFKTVVDIPPHMLESAAPEHVAFGCMPSYNVYGLKGPDLPGRSVPFRSAGGHIHFGYRKYNPENEKDLTEVRDIVKALDAIMGVASVSLFEGLEDTRRRQMYGMAGEYRLPEHGIEYRVLSNAWLCHPLITNITFDLARQAFEVGRQGLLGAWKADEKEVVDCIQYCDVKAARKILSRNKEMLFSLLSNCYKGIRPMVIQNVIMKGLKSVIKDPSDVAGNWDISKGTWIEHCNGVTKNVTNASIYLFQKKKVS